MNKAYILEQLKEGPKTAKEIAKKYHEEYGGEYLTVFSSTRTKLCKLHEQKYVTKIGTVDTIITTESCRMPAHKTKVKMILWGLA